MSNKMRIPRQKQGETAELFVRLAAGRWLAGFGVLAFFCGCAAGQHPAEETGLLANSQFHYEITSSPGFSHLQVRVCFEGNPPRRLVAIRDRAADLLVQAHGPGGEPLTIAGSAIDLGRLTPGSCIRYAVDLGFGGWGRDLVRHDNDLLLSHNLLLWWPEGAGSDAEIDVRFSLPGTHASAPWIQGDGPHTLTGADLQRAGNLALTEAPTFSMTEGETTVEVAVMKGALSVDRAGLQRWLSSAVQAVSTISGRFPRPHLHLVVVPIGEGSAPVAFGLVRRGGGPSVMLLVHDNATEERLTADWTAIHELTHLAMPQMYSEDRWLSEGFATYYQEVLRVRAGLLEEKEAWRRLVDRIAGAGERGGGRDLWQTSAEFSDVQRIYWGGTAFMLTADVALREHGSSLDRVVTEAQPAWLETADRTWHGRQCFAELDAAFGQPLLLPLVEQHGRRRSLPPMDALFARLGVVRTEAGIEFDEHAPLAPVRRAIMARAAAQ